MREVIGQSDPPYQDLASVACLLQHVVKTGATTRLFDCTVRFWRVVVHEPIDRRDHFNRSMTKLNARDRAQLVVIAYETGLVTPSLG